MSTMILRYILLMLSLACVGGRTSSSETSETSDAESDSPRDRRFAGRRLIVSTVLEPPYMMLKKEGVFLTGNTRFEGYLADMLSRVAYMSRFEYEIRLVRDGEYGSLGENGSWTGMIGELQREEADIAAGPLTITEERESVVEFTIPFMTFRSTALLRKPKRRKIRIHTASHLLDSHVPYGVIQNSITEQLFRETANATYRQMWARMATFWPAAFVQSIQEGLERVRREKYAFILDSPTAEYMACRAPCDIYTTEPFLDRRQYAFAMRKNNRFRDVIDNELIRMQETEEMQSMYLKWWESECSLSYSTQKSRVARTGRDLLDSSPTHPSPWRFATASMVQSGQLGKYTMQNILFIFLINLFCYVFGLYVCS